LTKRSTSPELGGGSRHNAALFTLERRLVKVGGCDDVLLQNRIDHHYALACIDRPLVCPRL
jgi:hypothetical protein